jgi:5'-nucleotidase
MLVGQKWHTAAAVADAFVEGLVADLPTEPVVVNINVPNCELDEVEGWRHTAVGTDPPRRLSSAVLEQLPGHEDAYLVRMAWGEPVVLPVDTDGGTVERNTVSITYLSRITATQRSDLEVAETSLSELLGAP